MKEKDQKYHQEKRRREVIQVARSSRQKASLSSDPEEYVQALERIVENRQLHSIRWLELRDAVYAVYMCYASGLTTLSKFAGDKPKAFFKYFSTYKDTLSLGFMLDIHTELGTLSWVHAGYTH